MSTERLLQIELMLKENPDDNFLNYAAALEFRNKGMKEKSIALLEGIKKRDPHYLAVYYQLGKIYEEDNQLLKAIEIYKAGKEIAAQQNDRKTLGELNEALMMLDEDTE